MSGKRSSIRSLLKKVKREHLIMGALIGLLILVAALPSGKNVSTGSDTDVLAPTETTIQTTQNTLEKQLLTILSQVEGIGEVAVAVTIGEDGNSGIYDTTQDASMVRGVIVVSTHGDDPIVAREIQEAVMSLFQVGANRIKIMKMK